LPTHGHDAAPNYRAAAGATSLYCDVDPRRRKLGPEEHGYDAETQEPTSPAPALGYALCWGDVFFKIAPGAGASGRSIDHDCSSFGPLRINHGRVFPIQFPLRSSREQVMAHRSVVGVANKKPAVRRAPAPTFCSSPAPRSHREHATIIDSRRLSTSPDPGVAGLEAALAKRRLRRAAARGQ